MDSSEGSLRVGSASTTVKSTNDNKRSIPLQVPTTTTELEKEQSTSPRGKKGFEKLVRLTGQEIFNLLAPLKTRVVNPYELLRVTHKTCMRCEDKGVELYDHPEHPQSHPNARPCPACERGRHVAASWQSQGRGWVEG